MKIDSLPKEFLTAIYTAEKAFFHIKDFLKPGITEHQAAEHIRNYLKAYGAEKESFRIIVASGKRSANIHGFATSKKIKRHEIVMIDIGGLYKNYRSDATRTYFLGKPTEKHAKVYDLLRRAQRAAMKKIKAGARCCDVDRAAREVVEKAGYGRFFVHSTGHGIRRKTHEPPKISVKNKNRLKAGDVITIEPGIYMDNWGGIRIEDMVLVTENGHKVLTKIPYKLRLWT